MEEEIKLERPYPLFKVVQEDILDRRGKTSVYYSIYVKVAENLDWVILYGTFSRPWSEIALERLREIFDTHIFKWMIDEDKNAPTMFMVNDQLYKTTYVFPHQSCICGLNIKGNERYAEFSVDSIKYDYLHSLVTFYYKGDCVVKANQVFLDGELLYNSTQLKELCDEIGQDFHMLDSNPDKLMSYLNNNYDVRTYTCEFYTCYNVKNCG